MSLYHVGMSQTNIPQANHPQVRTPEPSYHAPRRTQPAQRLLARPLHDVLCLHDFERKAKGYLPRPLYEYVTGGVEDNVSREMNRSSFEQWAIVPRVLVNVSQRTQSTQLMGHTYASPFGIAPMGVSALLAYRGDLVLAQAAQRAGIPMLVSGASLIKMEEIIKVAPSSAWFQAYVPGEPERIEALVQRVADAGFKHLVITVDTPTFANRENNLRAGFSTPLRPSLRLVWDGAMRPRWLLGSLARTFLNHGMPHFENQTAQRGAPLFSKDAVRSFGLKEHLSWEHLAFIRKIWKGRLIVKGILSAEDARLAADQGVDGIIVSNHGGRQLDCAVASLKALPGIVAAKGAMAVMIDSGFRRGTDVLKALCLGADFVFLGRPMIFAAGLGGEAGVDHAIDLLRQEIERDLALMGKTSIQALNKDCLTKVLDASHPEGFVR